MTQANVGTIDPDNTSGTELAALISNFEDALLSYHGGSSRPSYAVKNTIWADEDGDDDTFYLYTGSADVPLFQHDLSDGVMRIGFSGNLDTYIKPGSTSGLFIFSAGVEALDLTSARMHFYSDHAFADGGNASINGTTTESNTSLIVTCQTDGNSVAFKAGEIQSGKTTAHQVNARFVNDESEFYFYGVDDGTNNFTERLYFNFDDNEWGVGTPFQIRNTGTPSSSPTDGVVLYTSGGNAELVVRDEAGNTTTLSPHNDSMIEGGFSHPLAWGYYSEKREGTNIVGRINVDMFHVVKLVEQLTGEKLLYIEMDEPA